MGTVPTGKLERELRKLYVSWVAGLPSHEDDMEAYIATFRRRSTALIARLGGDIARLGSHFADFPAPKELELSPYAGKVYDEMQLAAVRAGVASGLQATDMARAMLRAGLERSFYKLNRLARTETVSAYWKNQWDSTRGLDLVLLWSVEFGPRTCAWCKERDGLVVEYSSIRDHPNGRCTLLPTLPQNVKYKGSIASDGTIFWDPGFERRAARMATQSQTASQPSQGSAKRTQQTQPIAPATLASKQDGKRAATTYVATAPDGTTFSRTSVRDYSWANLYFAEGRWQLSQMTTSRISAENFEARLSAKKLRNVLVPLARL